MKHVNGLRFGIDDPILFNAVLFVEVLFIDAVPLSAAQGNHFDHEVGRSGNDSLNDFKALRSYEHERGRSMSNQSRWSDVEFRNMLHRGDRLPVRELAGAAVRLFAAVWPPEHVLDHLDLALASVRGAPSGLSTKHSST